MIQEVIQWIAQQDIWVEPIFRFVVIVAAVKYIFFGS